MNAVHLALGLALFTQAPAKQFPVKMEVVAEKPDAGHTQMLHIKLTIQDDYWVFANPSGNENLPSMTEVSVSGRDVKITYPPGEVVKGGVIGDYRVYRGQVTVEAVIKRAAGGPPPEVALRVRPFDHGGCRWPTRTLKAAVP
jgi:hypothetical protein